MRPTLTNVGLRYGRRTLGAWAVLAGLVVTSACSTMRVETMPSPNADLALRRTFRILETPASVDSGTVRLAASARPMLNNSITNQWIRSQIQNAFEQRGYVMTTDASADVEVAFYANARERIRINNTSPYYCYNCVNVQEYTEGTIVIDVIDPETKRLLWRGTGVASVSDDPQKYLRKVNKAVAEIVADFPPAAGAVFVTR